MDSETMTNSCGGVKMIKSCTIGLQHLPICWVEKTSPDKCFVLDAVGVQYAQVLQVIAKFKDIVINFTILNNIFLQKIT
jgi:hypothetical protein